MSNKNNIEIYTSIALLTLYNQTKSIIIINEVTISLEITYSLDNSGPIEL